MAERILSGKIKQLVYTTEELSQSPLSTTVIDNGVLVYEKTSSGQIKCKMGDGNNVWSGLDYIEDSDKMDKNNPTGTGSLSMNRLEGSTIGKNSVALGNNNIVTSDNSFTSGMYNIVGNYIRYVIDPTASTNNLIIPNIETIPDDISVDKDILVLGMNIETQEGIIVKTTIKTIEKSIQNDIPVIILTIDTTKIADANNLYIIFIYTESIITNTNSPFPSASFTYAEGAFNIANGSAAHAEGYMNMASGEFSHAEGYMNMASGESSHAEGHRTESIGEFSHSEGKFTQANGRITHAEGYGTDAKGEYSHAEGYYTTANVDATASHIEGYNNNVNGIASHVEGYFTTSYSNYQHVQGKYNVEDTTSTYAHIVGGGTSDSDRKNIHTLDWNGNAVFSGDVTATNPDGTEVSLLSLQNSSSSGGSYNIQASTTDLTAGVSELATGTLYVVYEE